jgi:acetyltransferase
MIIEFHRHLSQQSVYLRYFQAFQFGERVRHERLSRICFIDYDRRITLVAEHRNPKTGAPEILGVAGLQKTEATSQANVL